MADGGFSMVIPSWLNRDYNPAETFLSAVKTGAAIGETQQRLAEEQRQADLKAQLERENMQNNLLKAQAELAVQQAYRSQQTDLAQQRLEEEKAYHTDLAQKSARDFMAQQEYRQAQLEGKDLVHAGSGVWQKTPEGLVNIIPREEKESSLASELGLGLRLQEAMTPRYNMGEVATDPSYQSRTNYAAQALRALQAQTDLAGAGSSTNKTSSGLRYEIKQK